MAPIMATWWFVAVICCLSLVSAVSSQKIEKSATGDADFPAIRNTKRAAAGVSGGRCIGLLCRSGALIVRSMATTDPPRGASTRLLQGVSSSMTDGQRIHTVDKSIAVALAGLSCDCKHVLQYLREEALTFRTNFGTCIPVSRLMESLSSYLHDFTTSGSTRPLAVSGLLAGTTSSSSAAETECADSKAVLMKFECDGGYEYYRACSTDTLDAVEDAAVVEALGAPGVGWGELTVEEAMTHVQRVLAALNVDDADDEGSEQPPVDQRPIVGGGDKSIVVGDLTSTGADTSSTSTSSPGSIPPAAGNRAQRVVEWAKVGVSLGGTVTLSSMLPK